MQLKFIKSLLLITALTLTVAVSGYFNPEVAQAQGPITLDIVNPTMGAPADAGSITSPSNITVSVTLSPTAVLTADNFAVTVGSITATLVSATSVSDTYNLLVTPPIQTISGTYTYDLAVSVVSGTLTDTNTVTNAVVYTDTVAPPPPPPTPTLMVDILSPTSAVPADAGLITSPTNITVSLMVSPTAVLTADNFAVMVGNLTTTLLSATPVSDSYDLLVTPPMQAVSGTYDLAVSVVSGTLTGTNTVTNAVAYVGDTPPPAEVLEINLLNPTAATPADAGLINSPTNITLTLAVTASNILTPDNFVVQVGGLTATVVNAIQVSNTLDVIVTPPTQTVTGTFDLMVMVSSGALSDTDTEANAVSYGAEPPPAEVLEINLLNPTAATPADAGLINSPTNITLTLAVTASNILTPDNFTVQVGGLTATLVNAIPVSDTFVVVVIPPTQTVTGTFDLMVMVSSGALSATDMEANAVSYAAEPPPAEVLEIDILGPTTAAPADAGLIGSPTDITVTVAITADETAIPVNFMAKIGGLTATVASMNEVSGTYILMVTPPTQTVTGTFDLMVMATKGVMTATDTEASAVSYRDDTPPAEELVVNIVTPTTTDPADAGLIDSPTNITVTLTVSGNESLVADDFAVTIGGLTATVVSVNEVSQTYSLLVTPPTQTVSSTFDLMVMVTSGEMSATDTEADAVAYTQEPPADELTLTIVSPTTANVANAGIYSSPTNITVTVTVSGATGLTAADFTVNIGTVTATVVSVNEVSGTYVLEVTPPAQTAAGTFDLMVMVASEASTASDTETDAVSYEDLPPGVTLIILGPTTLGPAYAGPAGTPHKIIVSVNKITTGLVSTDFTVSIGGLEATIVAVYEDDDRYLVEIVPPVQTANGLFDLVVKVQLEVQIQATMAQAVYYADTCNVDVSLILDRSGSMREFGYLAPAQSAASQFVDFMFAGDQVGVGSFATDAREDYPLTIVSPASKLEAKGTIDSLTAFGFTSIGGGLQVGEQQLGSSSVVTHPSAIVLLSDGKENRPPFVADVLPGVKDKGYPVHTIALGPESDQAMLADIAAQTGGSYNFAPTEQTLAGVYNSIANTVACEEEQQPIQSETGVIEEDEEIEYVVNVDGSLVVVDFSIFWTNPGSDIEFVIVAPDGTIIDPTIALTNDDIEFIIGPTYAYYRVRGAVLVPGRWTLRLVGRTLVVPAESFFTDVIGQIRGVAVTMRFSLARTFYLVRSPIKVVVVLADIRPIIGARVTTVIGPILSGRDEDDDDDDDDDNSRQLPNPILQLFDDGQHGDGAANDGVYANTLAEHNTAAPGGYTFQTFAAGTDNQGQEFTRRTQQLVTISADGSSPANTINIQAEDGHQENIFLPIIVK